MLKIAMYTTIKTLWEKGRNKTEIAEATGHDWKTVAKVISRLEQGQDHPIKKDHPRQLDHYKDEIIQWLEEDLSGIRIHEELQKLGNKAKYSTVNWYIRLIKKKQNIFIRIQTKPGEEAQVDFGYVGYTLDNKGKRRKTWVFNMKLSYSRYDYYETVYDQKVETFIRCHIKAFGFFRGVPEYVRIDNLKAAILQANFYEPIYQNLYQHFANYYGFKSIPCRVYTPNDKGKVESGIKYVKNNFFAGRKFRDENDLNARLSNWLNKTCNIRVHGTTKKIPGVIFEQEEAPKLLPLPLTEFKLSQVGTRKVYHDCHIYVNYNYYSVPFEYVGKVVEIEIGQGIVKIVYQDQQIAIHKELKSRGDFSTNKGHYPKYKMYSDTEFQEKYQAKMAAVGAYVEQLFFFLLKEQKSSWQRPVQGILALSKQYSFEIVDLSCKRALAFNVGSYQMVKNICEKGAYKLPIEFLEETYEYCQN